MPSTIRDLTELTTVATDDYFLVSDTSDVVNRDKRISQANMLGSAVLRSGSPVAGRVASWLNGTTLQDGGFAVADIARINVAQTYTASITVAPATGGAFFADLSPTSGVLAQRFTYNAATRVTVTVSASENQIRLYAFDDGSSGGPNIFLERNNNASTPAAGFFRMQNLNGGDRYIWPDGSGNLRIHTALPINANDTAGTVVGTQTSQLASKVILGDGVLPSVALQTLCETPVVEFEYQDGSYNHSRFHGIVAEWSPQFAMDEGRVFSPVSAFGYVCQSTKELVRRIAQLEAKLAEIQGD